MAEATPYHCAFLLEQQQARLHMALAWRRVGAVDYGVYLTRRPGVDAASPLLTMFKATYSTRGDLEGFRVRDGWCKPGAWWDDDHARQGQERSLVDAEDAAQLDALGDSFLSHWLESFGDTEMSSMFRRLGVAGEPKVAKAGRRIATSGLPVEVRKARLPDVLSRAEAKDGGMLFSFLPFPDRLGEVDPREDLLQAKMWMFFELL